MSLFFFILLLLLAGAFPPHLAWDDEKHGTPFTASAIALAVLDATAPTGSLYYA
jgi:hypothetical protein